MDCKLLKNQKKHVLLVGNSKVGKSSFVKMFNDEVKIGDGLFSCTVEVKPFLCKLQTLLGEEEFILIDSQGFNNTNDSSMGSYSLENSHSESSIASQLLYYLLKSVASNEIRLDKIFFFHAYSNPNTIHRIFKLISSIIGTDIGEISVIVHTKTNQAEHPKRLERETAKLKQLAEELKILGGVVRFETDWYNEEDNEYYYQVSDEKIKLQNQVIQNLIMQSNSSIDLTKEWKNIQNCAKILEMVEKYEPYRYNQWNDFKHSYLQGKEFIETPQKRLYKAIDLALEERITTIINEVYGKAPKQQQEKKY